MGYSTLFAVKFPKQVGYYDTQTFPIEFLLQEKVVKPLLGEKEIASPSAPFVFLQSEDSNDSGPQTNTLSYFTIVIHSLQVLGDDSASQILNLLTGGFLDVQEFRVRVERGGLNGLPGFSTLFDRNVLDWA